MYIFFQRVCSHLIFHDVLLWSGADVNRSGPEQRAPTAQLSRVFAAPVAAPSPSALLQVQKGQLYPSPARRALGRLQGAQRDRSSTARGTNAVC